MPSVYKEVEVDVDLDDFEDDELIEELERRGLDLNTQGVSGDEMRELLTQVWSKRRQGQDYQQALDQLIWYGLGRIV